MIYLSFVGFLERIFRRNPFRGLNDDEILELSRNHYLSTRSLPVEHLPSSSKRWETLLSIMGENILHFKNAKEVVEFAQKKMPFDHRISSASVFNVFALYDLQLRTEFPDSIELMESMNESRFSVPGSLYSWTRKKLVSNIFYYHLRIMLVCLTHLKTVANVIEIGGGYGALARLFLTHPKKRPRYYFIIDFPESLYFSEIFLRLNLDKVDILYFDGSLPSHLSEKESTVVLVPIQLAHALNDIKMTYDLVINSGSIGEVGEEWVDFWTLWADKVDCKFFYSLNYAGSPLDNWLEGANMMSPRFSKRWAFRLNRMNPAFMKLQSSCHFAEIIAEKMTSDHHWDSETLKGRYAQLKERFFDLQTYLESLDIARVTDDREILLDILDRCLNELPCLPKESYWILKKLEGLGIAELVSQKKELLAKLAPIIEGRFSAALRDYIHPISLETT